MLLKPPDENTVRALVRFKGDADGRKILEWLGSCLEHLDHTNRTTMDGIALRMSQGAAQALAEFIDRAEGKTTKASARPEANTRKGS